MPLKEYSMTFIVSNGSTLLADKLVSHRPGSVTGLPKGRTVKCFSNEATKIHRFAKPVLVYDRLIKAMAVAGDATTVEPVLSHLRKGYDLKELIHYETLVNVKPFFFTNDNTMMFLTHDCETVTVKRVGKHINTYTYATGEVVYTGAASERVDAVNCFLPKGVRLTPIEAHSVACRESKMVSEEFDYYTVPSDQLISNQKLSPRQIELMFEKLSKQLKLNPSQFNSHYSTVNI